MLFRLSAKENGKEITRFDIENADFAGISYDENNFECRNAETDEIWGEAEINAYITLIRTKKGSGGL